MITHSETEEESESARREMERTFAGYEVGSLYDPNDSGDVSPLSSRGEGFDEEVKGVKGEKKR